jgi:glucokinase
MIGAVDIGGTKIAAGIVTREGQIVAERRCPTLPERGFEHAFERISAMLTALRRETAEAIEGIGIGCTGPIDPRAGVVLGAELLHGWSGAPIVDRLAQAFGVPTAMENDADAVALSESVWGLGRGAECMVYITIGTGIGGGIIRQGELYRGAGGAHPEIGHMVVDASAGPMCYCGLTGCWESLASGPAIENWYAGRAEPATAAEICRLAADGDPNAATAVRRLSRYIGLGLVNVVTAYCPDVIVLGGGIMRSAGLFLADVRRQVCALATQVPTANLRIETVPHSGEAGLQGAAAVWLHRYGSIRRSS